MLNSNDANKINELLGTIREEEIIDVDFRFTDPCGGWHHMTFSAQAVNENLLQTGIMFDASSIGGWKSIEDSDMVLYPDLSKVYPDPFSLHPTLIIFCDILDPHSGLGYERDPRTTAKKAEAYLQKTGIAEKAIFGPEPEFFIFDEVEFDLNTNYAFYHVSSDEASCINNPIFSNTTNSFRSRQGHRPGLGGGYAPVAPVDIHADIRSDMLIALQDMGMHALKHHHEVAPAQHELGFECDSLLNTGDNIQLYKYSVKNVAKQHDKTATFMPKPVHGDNGSGMHVHQSLWSSNDTLFLGDQYNDLSEMALHYIGGILKHSRALNAFTNPTTNSYKRMVPGYEAPIYRAYSARNRSASVRIPHTNNEKAKRIEVRFPDATANPYLSLAALMMAGLDGIQNKIDPGEATEKNLYDASQHTLGPDDLMSTSLTEALDNLDKDRAFLTKGNVFTNDQIDGYIELKRKEITEILQCPTPAEFKLYYSA